MALALRVLLATVMAALAVVSRAAWADGDAPRAHTRVVLVSMPESVFAATAAALGPWSIAVEATAEPAPVGDAAARTIADVHGATAVAWIEAGELVIYDAIQGGATRSPAPVVADEAAAASVALTIKTALRRPIMIPEPPTTTVALVDAPSAIAPPVLEAPPPPGGERPGGVRIGVAVDAGVRVPAGSAPVLTRLVVRGSLAPRAWRGVGVWVAIEGGAPGGVDAAGVDATLSDLGAGAGVEWRRAVASRVWLVPALGASVHRVTLDGRAGEIAIARADPAAAVDASIALELGGALRAGLVVTGSYFARRVRYTLDGDDVVGVAAAQLGVAVRVVR